MKAIANIIGVIGILLLVYAVIARFVNGPTAFGYILAVDPKTVVLGANSLILVSIFLSLAEKK